MMGILIKSHNTEPKDNKSSSLLLSFCFAIIFLFEMKVGKDPFYEISALSFKTLC